MTYVRSKPVDRASWGRLSPNTVRPDLSPRIFPRMRSPGDGDSAEGRNSGTLDGMPLPVQEGLGALLWAHNYAVDLAQDAWDFAVEFACLRNLGITNNDLRWMVGKGWVEYAEETTPPDQDRRTFQCGGVLTFAAGSCFILTSSGVSVAQQVCEEVLAGRSPAGRNVLGRDGVLGGGEDVNSEVMPKWDAERHQLFLGSTLVKEFKLPSPNQGTILMAFEEERWPARIDDPLPPSPNVDSKARLRYTIKSLNKNQKKKVIRFMGDGTGEGIRWESID